MNKNTSSRCINQYTNLHLKICSKKLSSGPDGKNSLMVETNALFHHSKISYLIST